MNTTYFRNALIVATVGLLASTAATTWAESPTVVYEKYLTAVSPAEAHDLVVDDSGNVYIIAGRPGVHYATIVVKLDESGDIVWSRVIDGSEHDIPGGIAIDAAGDVYITGTTASPDFPLVNAYQSTLSSVKYEAFIAKLSGDDGTFIFSTYFGAVYSEWGHDIAVNDAGEVYIVGMTESPYFPTTADALQDQLGGDPFFPYEDAYISKFSSDGSQLLYSTYFGGGHVEVGKGIALDDAGRIYIAGQTQSDDLPVVNPAQATRGGYRDAFAARLSADGSAIEYCTYAGGEEVEDVWNLALDASGRLYATGRTQSVFFPTTVGAFQPTFAGEVNGCEVPFGGDYNCDDAFVICLAPDGGSFDYATYLGGDEIDHGYGVAVNAGGQAYATGHTRSDNFPPHTSGTTYAHYLTKLDQAGANVMYSYLFQTNTPSLTQVAVDPTGAVYFASTEDSPTDLVVTKLVDETPALVGDMNCDGVVDFGDINGFVMAVVDGDAAYQSAYPGCEYTNADINDNGSVGFDDINPFVTLVLGN